MKDNEWVRHVLTQEEARIERQAATDRKHTNGRPPGGFVCSMRMGKVER